MKKGLTEIVIIMDKSGSMSSMKEEAIQGINKFIKEQKLLPSEAKVTFALFNDSYQLLYDGIDIQNIKEITSNDYIPDNTTALLDAIGKTFTTVGTRLANTKESERPEKVLVVILSDGMENSSKGYKLTTIKDMIKHQQEKYSWNIIFLAAGLEAEKMQQYGNFTLQATVSNSYKTYQHLITDISTICTNYRKSQS